jgi:ubiquinone/menaquinone biosynthesis C-methylase UbiE
MTIDEATRLIQVSKLSDAPAQTWCELGCGTGTFTLALAGLLPPGSIIHALDKNKASLAEIPGQYQEVTIHKEVVNLNKSDLSLPKLDGVFMANFLHYIKHQTSLVEKLRKLSERLLIVEYDHRPRSPWIPYPLGFAALRSLLLEQGFTRVDKVGSRASRFGGEMYSAFAG